MPDSTVLSFWVDPVKSVQGEKINPSFVSKRGLLGDRAYAPKAANLEDFAENARIDKILRTAVQHNGANVGVYAEVVQSGRIKLGDTIRIL